MLYFSYFMIGAWMLAIGWFLGVTSVKNRNEKMESPRVSENSGRCPECGARRLPAVASAARAASV